jgi:hypothetical protein
MFHDHLPVPAPQVRCAACKNGHPKGECPFKRVTEEMEQNYENPNHPAVKFFSNTYHDYFPKHCMVCHTITHSTHKCPHDDMRFIQHGGINRSRATGYVPPLNRYSLEQLNIDMYSSTSSGNVDMYSSTLTSDWSYTSTDEDDDAYITTNPPCPMPSTPPLVEESPVTIAPASVGWKPDELQAIIAEEYTRDMDSLPFVYLPTDYVTTYSHSLDTIQVTSGPEPVVVSSPSLGETSYSPRQLPKVPFYKLICKKCKQIGHLKIACPNNTFMDKIQCYQRDQLGHYAKDCPLTEHPGTPRDVNISMDQITCFKCMQLGHFGFMCRAPTARVYTRSVATPNTSAQPLKSVSFDPTLPSRPSERSSIMTSSADVQTHTSTINPLPITSVYQCSNKNHPWFLNRQGRFQALQYLREL